MPTRNPGYNLNSNMEEGKRADEVGVSEGVPQLILIYDHLPRCSINVPYAQLCHKGSGTRTPIQQLNMKG